MTNDWKLLTCGGLLLMASACGIQPPPPSAPFPDPIGEPLLLPAQPDLIDIGDVGIDPPIELEAEPAFELPAEPVYLGPVPL